MSAGEAIARLRDADPPFRAVVIPVRPGGEGVELVRRARAISPATAVVALLYGDARRAALAALSAGADGCLPACDADPRRLAAAAGVAVCRSRSRRARFARRLRVLHVADAASTAALRRHLETRAPHLRLALAPQGPAVAGAARRAWWDVLLLDREAWPVEVMDALREAGERPVVLVVSPGEEEAGVQALRLGAAGLVVRGPGWLEQVSGVLEQALAQFQDRRARAEALRRLPPASHPPTDRMIGNRVTRAERPRREDPPRRNGWCGEVAAAGGVGDGSLESEAFLAHPALPLPTDEGDDERDGLPGYVQWAMYETLAHLEGGMARVEPGPGAVHDDVGIRGWRDEGDRPRGTSPGATERRRIKAALRRSRAESWLAGRVLTAHEEERRRIARELHDDLSQRVAALGIGISRLTASEGEAAAQAARLHAEVGDLAERIRTLSHRMHPALLEHAGLVSALSAVCDETQRADGIRVAFTAACADTQIPANVAIVAYRVAQEGLRNVVRHAGVGQARITVACVGGALELVVADHGAGFDPARAPWGLGLVSMAERAHLLGGDFHVVSVPGGGTELRARLPLGDPAKQAPG
ncbi:sensor histidine kinase [Longimicrobium sp.]|uniref:sensor histidine kinase n=1 Tax=Longimicrobium sp. TaxID=2029185 RepID=UPI002E3126D0|nr:ATP-binding protein [Longimicrobium sp.]HEX6039501.1 ATP-binding protein [Longimicrobium sp.]